MAPRASILSTAHTITEGPWTIEFDPPAVPFRDCDWSFTHENYDGAPDAWAGRRDPRHGRGASPEDCREQIAEIEAEMAEEAAQRRTNAIETLKALASLSLELGV